MKGDRSLTTNSQLSTLHSQIPKGYKQTEVGVIPDDWKIRSLAEVVTFLDGKRCPVKDSDRSKMQGSIPYYGASGIVDYVNDYLFDDDLILLGEDGENILSRNCRLAFRVSGKIWVNNHAHVLKPNSDTSIGFLTDYLESLSYERFNSGTAQPKLNKQACSQIPIAFPPTIAEQNLIARALSDTDALIESLEQLLAKKRQIKQGAMQELLRSKDTWDKEEIRNILTLIMDYRGRTPKKLGMEWGGGDIRALSAGNVKRGWIDFEAEAYFASEALYQKWMTQGVTKENDILVTTEAPLGNIAIIPDSKKYILSQRVISLRTDPQIINSKYLYHYISSEIFQELLKKDSSGSTATGIQRLKLEKILIAFPSLAEQQAIATILSDMDLEIGAIETKLTKARQLKQGMMHELLTGKIRLIDKGNT